jgi:Tfp pilus assembly protein PilN
MIIIVIAVLIVAVLLYVVPFIIIKIQKASLESTKKELASDKFNSVKQMKKEIADLDSKISFKKEVIADIDKDDISFNELMNSIEKALPKNCSIISTEYKYKTGEFKVGIKTGSIVSVAEFTANFNRLNTSKGILNSVDTRSGIGDATSKIFDVTFKLRNKEGK